MPSYKLKKEKWEAKRTDSSNPTDDSSLVDPSSVSVIGVVGDSSSTQASTAPTEKKPKKDKMPAKPKKSVESSSADSKISELDPKWLERFNRLEALIMSKSFQPTFSADGQMLGLHLHTLHLLKFQRTQNTFFSQPTGMWTSHLLSALVQTLMLPCSCRPVSYNQTRIKDRYLKSALAQTHMLHSISRPVSSSPILTDPSHLHQGALVQTLLQSTS